MKRFSGKSAIITGATGDIGKAISRRLLEEGGKIMLFSRSVKKLDIFLEELVTEGFPLDDIKYFTGDVTSIKDCIGAADFTIKVFNRIDILVTAAGILRHFPIDELSEKDWKDVIDINLTGTFFSSKAVVKYMKAQKYGRIVFISSIGGRTVRPSVGVNYAASKAGIVGMTQLLGYELGPWDITVNAVAPGPIKGGMFTTLSTEAIEKLRRGTRIQRLGELNEVAAAVAYLASDEAGWTTGEILDVNGGLQF